MGLFCPTRSVRYSISPSPEWVKFLVLAILPQRTLVPMIRLQRERPRRPSAVGSGAWFPERFSGWTPVRGGT